ncbi:LysR family transcriptional regulator [Actinomadura sp. HBU206391]|uniref:LysR family transcriptional regulator n=1 Tax=Actinomadura sp. HBU206391 TaxID=2731692 RepID=UPI0016504236|nr:LysR family transcriptional regulator [Actinomadura sp. HBU206391]MBC6462870.1 LysR family transcriptional regulator [Actinomadura sp. HBU206391]
MAEDLDLRLLRHFVAVAEELHFSRAAQRLFVAQQALSRDVRKLEERVGTPLFDRTSRNVMLTPAGQRLLVRARQILSLHDEILRELRGQGTSLLVDVVGERLTPALVLAGARACAPGCEFFARYHGGLAASLPLLAPHRLDVTFGRWHGVAGQVPEGLAHRLIRYERICVLLPEHHPLATRTEIPLAALRDADACWHCGDHASAEWEHAMLQLFTDADLTPTPPRPNVRGTDELAYHLQHWDMPVLTISSQPEVPGAVIRPLVDPLALYPWSMIWCRDQRHPGLTALLDAARDLAEAHGWLDLPEGAWLPDPEASLQTHPQPTL